MRKKILAIVFAAVLAMAVAVPALAGEHANQDGGSDQANVDPASQQAQSPAAEGNEDQE